MMPQDYQDLIDRGWRRSGDYIYKPKNDATCCPCYTIKCDTHQFKPTKSHKKIIKRLNKFLKDGVKPQEKDRESIEKYEGERFQETPDMPDTIKKVVKISQIEGNYLAPSDTIPLINDHNETLGSTSSQQNSSTSSDVPPRKKKAKQMRMERKKAKCVAQGKDYQPKMRTSQEKSLRDFIEDVGEENKHKLEVKLVASTSAVTKVEFELYKSYQIIVHKDPPSRPTVRQFERFLVKSPMKLRMVPVMSKMFEDTIQESFHVYKEYQTIIHKDKPREIKEYLQFLVETPLKHTRSTSLPEGYGSFHHQYWLDDKLIAVGVLDILPNCVSSVYFFYDPEYSFLSLGTYSSLRELEFTQRLSETVPSLKYYYMGFYIHSCPKMRYKANLIPSYLLCPETYTWCLLTDAMRTALDANKYQKLNKDQSAVDPNEFIESTDLDSVLVLHGEEACTYRTYIQSFKIDTLDNLLDMVRSRIYEEGCSCVGYVFEAKLKALTTADGQIMRVQIVTGDDDVRSIIIEYAKLVGKRCAHRMLYLLPE